MRTADDEFRDFVSGFSDPLMRLAFVLLAADAEPGNDNAAGNTESLDEIRAERAVVAALAHTRRRWREVHETGAPEPLAVEALLARLPHRRRPGRRVAAPGSSEPDAGSIAQADEPTLVRDAIWRTWKTIHPRERVPLLFADIGVISRRLDNIDIPESFASPRRLYASAAGGFAALRAALVDDAVVSRALATLGVRDFDNDIRPLLADTLREHAHGVVTVHDPYPAVVRSARRGRTRLAVAVVGVVGALTAAAIVMTNVPPSRPKISAVVLSPSQARESAVIHVTAPPAQHVFRSYGNAGPVIDWPFRTDIPRVRTLMANVGNAFVADHAEVPRGSAQVLLATDTPWFRVVLIAANTPKGTLESWYYGPIDSDTLRQGAFSYEGTPFGHDTVVADVLTDSNGHSALLVVGPPETTRMQLGNLFLDKPLDATNDMPYDDGVAIADMSGISPTALLLRVSIGEVVSWYGRVPAVSLAAASGGPSPQAASPVRENTPLGHPDPVLLQGALVYMHQLMQSGQVATPSVPITVWGGRDSGGTDLVVLRGETDSASGFVVAIWSGAAGTDRALTFVPNAPAYPFAFEYTADDGARVGVLAQPGVAFAGLVVDGVDLGQTKVGATGFAGLRVGHQYGTLAEQTLAVDLFDASGHQIGRVAVPPHA